MSTNNKGEPSQKSFQYSVVAFDKATGTRFEKGFTSLFLANKFKNKVQHSKKLEYVGDFKNF